MDDVNPMPAWKRQLANARKAQPVNYERALDNVCRQLDIEAYLLKAAREDRRGFLKMIMRKIPQQVSAQVDHAITVKIVKQVGEKEVLISLKGSQDAKSDEQLPLVPASVEQSVIDAATDEDDG